MESTTLIGGVLVAGLVIFLVGAVAWRLDYQRPLHEALPAIHRDRRRWAWIHSWMIAGLVVTLAGLVGLTLALVEPTATVLAGMATAIYGVRRGLLDRLLWPSGSPWCRGPPSRRLPGRVPDGVCGLRPVGWSAVRRAHAHRLSWGRRCWVWPCWPLTPCPTWLGWAGILWGLAFAGGFVATRFAGPFNPPFWAHLYTGTVGLVLLLG